MHLEGQLRPACHPLQLNKYKKHTDIYLYLFVFFTNLINNFPALLVKNYQYLMGIVE